MPMHVLFRTVRHQFRCFSAFAARLFPKVGAGVPVLTILFVPTTTLVPVVSAVSPACLVSLGAIAARIGGAPMFVGAARVAIRGVLTSADTRTLKRALYETRDSMARD
jgi:hypothetical protein